MFFFNVKDVVRVCLWVLLVVTLTAGTVSCSKRAATPVDAVVDPDGHSFWHPGMECCYFRVVGGSDGTKAVSVSYTDESRVNRWGLYVFDSAGNYVVSAASSAGQGVQKFFEPGTYTVVAFVNYPVTGSHALDPSVKGSINKLSDLDAFVPRMEDMAYNSLMMCGSDALVITEGSSVEKNIDVRRLVAKVGIKKVTLNWSNPGHAQESFTLKHIYLTNVYGDQALRQDQTYAQMSSIRGHWFNAMGYHASGSRQMTGTVEAMTADRDINAALYDGVSYTTQHYFYAFPNACAQGENVTSSSWSARSTCLVVEALCGGLTYYYRVALPPMHRNATYNVEELVIKNLGSLDPNADVPNSMSARFVFTTGWDGVGITENS